MEIIRNKNDHRELSTVLDEVLRSIDRLNRAAHFLSPQINGAMDDLKEATLRIHLAIPSKEMNPQSYENPSTSNLNERTVQYPTINISKPWLSKKIIRK